MADAKEQSTTPTTTTPTATTTTTSTTTTSTTPANNHNNGNNNNNNNNTTDTPAEPPQVTRQKYDEAKQELQALLARKKQVDTNLINLEHAIYLFEGSYLEDTQQNGNIIRGFDGYLANRTDRRKPKFTELDRLFSLSSSTYQKEEKDQDSSQDDRSVNSAAGSLSARREKKRKMKGQDGINYKKKKLSAGRDSDDDLDV
ncbi:hypothetical protein RMCBS344292_15215 [Rhizopus microsporus]|nr:hypothetical protein RMCBS344292_15215 [Rhizopus microsporus]